MTGRHQVRRPLLNILQFNIEPWRDDSALVEPSIELHYDFVRSVIIDDLEIVDVSVLLHGTEEADDDFRTRANEHLSNATFFGVYEGF